MSRQEGDVYEVQFEHTCRALKYQVIRPQIGNQRAWDRMVNGKRVQVKKRCVDPTKPNSIRLVTSRSSADFVYDTDSVDVFAIFWDENWFIVPALAIADECGQIRNGLYMPSVSLFKGMWEVLNGERVECSRQTIFEF